MKKEVFQDKLNLLKEMGYKILFETSGKNISFKTYMADELGNTVVIQSTVKENGDVDFQQVNIQIREVQRLCEEATKVYNDALAKRCCINK